MKYRTAIENALRAWDGIWFHWNKSDASKAAAMILRRIIGEDSYDDQLKAAVDWFLGRSQEPFHYMYAFDALKTTSSLYAQLDAHVGASDVEPANLKPVVQPSAARLQRRPVRVQQTPTVVAGTSLATASSSSPKKSSIAVQLMRYQEVWKTIKITDIPTGKHGRYEHTADDPTTTMQKGSAAAVIKKQLNIKTNALKAPAYWVELGRMVFKSKKGRCFSCAGAALFTLTNDEYFDNYEIVVMGNKKYDHYFVCIGSTLGEIEAGLGTAVDIWQANLADTPDVFAKSPAKDFMYWNGAQIICSIPRDQRQLLRDFVIEREKIEHL
ncbi:hypothetical protein [Pseudomonas gingeri]|uniref:hypothetical protein n=1 Tax=Pseudomonas gingeri TaxID=117681 RepID=UPI0015A34627|nr:hypothetical protein [Pseudomonas gingeri]NWA09121.1 hypothetical protein [Pseudomonas gingeri]